MKRNIVFLLRTTLIVVLTILFSIPSFAGGNGDYYAKVTAKVSKLSPTGSGTVYVNPNGNNAVEGNYAETSTGGNVSKSSGANVNVYIFAKANTGYVFEGWAANDNSKTYESTSLNYTKNVAVSTRNKETNARQYNVYAVFRKAKYKVSFDSNGGSGSMADQDFVYGEAQTLSENRFTKSITVEYNTNGGSTISNGSYNLSFSGWTYNGTSYSDKQSVNNLTTEDGKTVTMTAKWSSANVTLPKPTKRAFGVDLEFDGWYDAAEGGNKIGNAGATVAISDNCTLYAHWKVYEITINITSNDFNSGDTIFFIVTKTDAPTVYYTVPIAIAANGRAVVKGVPAGTYSIAPNGWAWNYTVSPSTASATVNSNKTFNFTVNSKNSTKQKDEKSKVNWGNGN